MSNATTPWQRLSYSVLTVEQHRQVDRTAIERYHMHSLVLMENAARGCAEWLDGRLPAAGESATRKLVVLCGKGNNGGDGLAILRHAEVLGWDCTAFVAGQLEELSADATANAQIILSDAPVRNAQVGSGSRASVSNLVFWHEDRHALLAGCLAEADVVLDAMLGTGAQGNPKPPFSHWIDAANASRGLRVAIDMPTGVDATTGERADHHFRADATLTFVALKPAMVQSNAGERFGTVEVLPIGIPKALIEELVSTETNQA